MRIRLTTDDLFHPFARGTEWDVVDTLDSGIDARVYRDEYEIIESGSESNMSENSESELSENTDEILSEISNAR